MDIDQDGVLNDKDFAPYINNHYLYVSGIEVYITFKKKLIYYLNNYHPYIYGIIIFLILTILLYSYRKRKINELEKKKREIIEELEEILK